MGCITRECLNPECGYADGNLPPIGLRYTCPKCGQRLSISFDEHEDHGEYEQDDPDEEEETLSDEHWISK